MQNTRILKEAFDYAGPLSWSNWNLEWRRKTFTAKREPTTNSTHIVRRWALSPLRQAYSPYYLLQCRLFVLMLQNFVKRRTLVNSRYEGLFYVSLVQDGKENSDWFPQRSVFCTTGRYQKKQFWQTARGYQNIARKKEYYFCCCLFLYCKFMDFTA